MFFYTYILSAVAAFLACLLFSPPAIRLGKRLGTTSAALDPEITRPAVPDIGGIPVIIAIGIGIASAVILLPDIIAGYAKAAIGIGAGTIIIAVLGFVDDRRQLSPGIKFALQIIAALVVVAFEVKIVKITNPFNTAFELGFLSVPVTVLWIVGITNAVNMIDGLDGLAPGVIAIAGFALFTIGAYEGFPFLAVIMASVFGATLAFLHFNYPPARIILGNNGAYALGFIIAASSIVQPVKASAMMVLFVPILALGLPVLEMLITVFRRAAKKRKVYLRDTEHLHHVLLSLGLPARVVDWIFYAISLLFATVAVGFACGEQRLMIISLILLMLAFSVAMFLLATYVKKKEKI